MRMIHALSVQLRQVFSWKLLSCILVFAGVQGLAISGLIYVTPDPSALYYYVLSTTSGTTYLTFYVLPTIPFSMSLAQEWDAHATPYWVIRSGGGVYTFSKLMGGAMAGFFTVGGGSLLFLVVAGVIAGNFGPTQGIDTIYQSLLEQGQIVGNVFHHPLSQPVCGGGSTDFLLFAADTVAHRVPNCRKLHLLAFLLVFRRTYRERCLPGVWRKSSGYAYLVRGDVPSGNPCDEKEASSCVVSRWWSHPRELVSAAG